MNVDLPHSDTQTYTECCCQTHMLFAHTNNAYINDDTNNIIKESSGLVSWKFPENLNRSCYESILLRWWTNDSDHLHEQSYDLTTNNAVVGNLNSKSGYYVQVNFITPQRVEIPGFTRSFVLSELKQQNQSSSETLYGVYRLQD